RQLLECQVDSWFSKFGDTVNQVLEGKSGLSSTCASGYHNSVSFQEPSTEHRVEFNDPSLLSGHSDLLRLSFEILQIAQDSFLGGLVSGAVEEDYFPTSDLSCSQDACVDHVLDVRLDCRPDSAYSPGDAIETIDQPRVLV